MICFVFAYLFGPYVDFILLSCSSNASDALDKLRFLSVTEPSLLGDAGELQIRIKPDPDNGTITITYVFVNLCFLFVPGWISGGN